MDEQAGMASTARWGLIDKKIPTRFSSGCFVFPWSFRLFCSYLSACLFYPIVPSPDVAQSSIPDADVRVKTLYRTGNPILRELISCV